MLLYKYRGGDENTFERDLKTLEENSFFAPCAKELNDPCETIVFTDKLQTQNRIFSKILGKQLGEGITNICSGVNDIIKRREQIGIYSLSQTPLNELLWAHYSYNHTGFCIEYDSEILTNKNSFSKFYLIPIKYSKEPPQIDFLDITSTNTNNLLQKIGGYKSVPWNYEKEIRLISDNSKQHYYDFNALKSIYFGLRMNKFHKLEIMKRLQGRGIKYHQITLDKETYSFHTVEIADKFKDSESYLFRIYRKNAIKITEIINYKIVELEYASIYNKGTLTIKLEKKIHYNELKELGYNLKNKLFKSANRVYIYYNIPNLSEKQGTWAITHYEKNGNTLEILGSTIEDENYFLQQINKTDNRDIIGQWIDETPYSNCLTTIFKKGKRTFIEDLYKDKSPSINEYDTIITNDGIRIEDIGGNKFGEYIILKDDILRYYSEDGLFRTLKNNLFLCKNKTTKSTKI